MRTTWIVIGSAVSLAVASGLGLSQDKTAQGSKLPPTPRRTAQTNAPASGIKATADYPVIGYLEKRDCAITIKAGPKGPLYSIRTADGKELCHNLSKEQLTAQAPELGEFLKNAVAGAGVKTDARVRLRAE